MYSKTLCDSILAALAWLAKKIARCVTCKGDEEEGKKGPVGVGREAGGEKQRAACRREQRRQEQEDRAYSEVQTYDYEQYG